MLFGFWLVLGDLKLECAKILYEVLLIPVLLYGSEIMIRKGKKRYMIGDVQMDNLKRVAGYYENAYSTEYTDKEGE